MAAPKVPREQLEDGDRSYTAGGGGGGGGGGVTSVDITPGAGIAASGGPVTSSGAITVALAAITTQRLMANVSGASAAPSANTLTAILDNILGSTQGQLITRNAANWTVLGPGTLGLPLLSGGAGANLSYAQVDTAGLANDATTNAKLANMATQTFKGRTTAGTGDPEDLTIAQAQAMLGTNVLPSFRAYQSAAQSIGSTAHQLVTFSNLTFDTTGGVDTANHWWKCPAGMAGTWLFGAAIRALATTNVQFAVAELYLNGTVFAQGNFVGFPTTNTQASSQVTSPVVIAVNDIVDFRAFTQYVGSGSLTNGDVSNYFWGVKIG